MQASSVLALTFIPLLQVQCTKYDSLKVGLVFKRNKKLVTSDLKKIDCKS